LPLPADNISNGNQSNLIAVTYQVQPHSRLSKSKSGTIL